MTSVNCAGHSTATPRYTRLYAREKVGASAKSGAFHAGGVTREQIASGMAWWLDATQSLPPA